jgi:hypothetical protein
VDGALHAARQGLLRYEANVDEGSTLSMLTQLSELTRSTTADPQEKAEGRFLRAAAATDLLVLARVRDDARLLPALEAALGAPAGTVYDHLDAELVACAQLQNYAGAAVQMRSVLALARDPEPAKHLASYRGVSGSERDLLFLHAIGKAAITDANPVQTLASYGEPLAADSTVHGAFDDAGSSAVATLIEAGYALKRLQVAAKNGDPLAKSAAVERAVFSVAIPGIVIPASPKLPEAVAWPRGERAPDLVLFANEKGVSYSFTPSAQLDNEGNIKLVGRGEPLFPNIETLSYRGNNSAIQPIHALSERLRDLLTAQPDSKVAVVVAPDAPAAMLGNVLASFKMGGGRDVMLITHDAKGQAVAQTLAIELGGQLATQPIASPELSVRVRLSGYSIKSQNGTELEIPRIYDRSGSHLDIAALLSQLGRRRSVNLHVSFVPGVPSREVTATLFELASNQRSFSVLLR